MDKNLLEIIKPPKTNDSNSVFHHIVKKAFYLNKNIYSYNTTEYIKDMVHQRDLIQSRKI